MSSAAGSAAPPARRPLGRGIADWMAAMRRKHGAADRRGGLERFEHLVTAILKALMVVVVSLSVVELGVVLVMDVVTPPVLLLEFDELLDIFGWFLMVLIGLELLETIKSVGSHRVVRVEIVLLVALIALGRKLVTLDVEKYAGTTLLGLAAVILALAVAVIALRAIGINGAVHRAARGPDAEGGEDATDRER